MKKNKVFKLKKANEIPTNDIKISLERTYSVPTIEINGHKIIGKIEKHLILDIGRISSLKIISNY